MIFHYRNLLFYRKKTRIELSKIKVSLVVFDFSAATIVLERSQRELCRLERERQWDIYSLPSSFPLTHAMRILPVGWNIISGGKAARGDDGEAVNHSRRE